MLTALLALPIIASDAKDWTKTNKIISILFILSLDTIIIVSNF